MSLFQSAITTTGYVRVPMTSITAELNALWAVAFGSDADLDPRSADGQIIGGLSEMFSDLEGGVADLYNGVANPNGATGQFLTNIAGVNGVSRNAGAYSYVPVMFTGTNGTNIPTGTVLQSTQADGTVASWSNIYTLTNGVPVPGTVVGSSNSWAICTILGAVRCPAGSSIKLMTVLAGVTGVSVTSDATLGYVSEGDPNLRLRRQSSFSLASQGMADGLQAALSNMRDGGNLVCSQAAVWENNTGVVQNFPGGGTLNPYSIRPVVVLAPGANPNLVTQKIYNLKAPGCSTQGNTSGYAVDEQSNQHLINFDAASAVRVGVRIYLVPRSGWPTDGAAQIAAAIAAWALNPMNTTLGGDSQGQLSCTAILGSFVGTVPGWDFSLDMQGRPGMQICAHSGPGFVWLDPMVNLSLSFVQYATIAASDVFVYQVSA
jgi:hypothetical protein